MAIRSQEYKKVDCLELLNGVNRGDLVKCLCETLRQGDRKRIMEKEEILKKKVKQIPKFTAASVIMKQTESQSGRIND